MAEKKKFDLREWLARKIQEEDSDRAMAEGYGRARAMDVIEPYKDTEVGFESPEDFRNRLNAELTFAHPTNAQKEEMIQQWVDKDRAEARDWVRARALDVADPELLSTLQPRLEETEGAWTPPEEEPPAPKTFPASGPAREEPMPRTFAPSGPAREEPMPRTFPASGPARPETKNYGWGPAGLEEAPGTKNFDPQEKRSYGIDPEYQRRRDRALRQLEALRLRLQELGVNTAASQSTMRPVQTRDGGAQ